MLRETLRCAAVALVSLAILTPAAMAQPPRRTVPTRPDRPPITPGMPRPLPRVTLPAPAPADPDTAFLRQLAETFRFRLGRPGNITVTPDGRSVLFLRSGPRDFVRDLYEYSLATGRERVLLTAETLLGGREEHLTPEEKARRERQRLLTRGIASYDLSKDGATILVPLAGSLYVVDRATGRARELTSDSGVPIDPRLSPDGRSLACVRGGDLYVTDLATGRETRLTTGAGETLTHGLSEFVAQEEMSRHHGFWWSPDSRRILYQETDVSGVETFTIADPTHPEKKPDSWPYPRPGHPNAKVRLGILPVTGGPTTWIDWDNKAYEYLAQVAWTENGPLTIVVQNRTQTEERVLAVDPASGATRTLLTERDPAWINIIDRLPVWLPRNEGFLWMTERHGFMELELRAPDGSLTRSLTPTDIGIQEFELYLEPSREAIVRASVDATQAHVVALPLDPRLGPPRMLTSEEGVQDVVTVAAGGPYFVAQFDTPRSMPRWEVLNRAGATGKRLTSVAETPPWLPNVEFVTVAGDPSLNGLIIRPRNFRVGRTYPVILSVYGGPGHIQVARQASRYFFDQWFADRGYIVVSFDGRGTPYRGRAWERSVKDDLITLPLEDQARGVLALCDRFPELDRRHVAVYGWSFGGYFAAMAVLRRPDVFAAGVAGAPVTDWHDYDTHYTERYMGLPDENPAGYRDGSCMTWAEDLTRPLLLIHGTSDDNVYFLHSLKLADALFRAGKTCEFLPLVGFTHLVPDPLVTQRLYMRILGFFEETVAGR